MPQPSIEIKFPFEPVAVQSARFFRCGNGVRSYQPAKVTDFKRNVRLYAKASLPVGFRAFQEPIKLEVDFVFAPPQSMRKRDLARISSGEIVWRPHRPDLTDNLLKGLADALTGTVWEDDAMVCEVHSRKIYGMEPCIKLMVSPLSACPALPPDCLPL